MKNLLSMLAVSTLVGTSVSSLKPVFITNNLVSHGFKSNQSNNKDISIQTENDTNTFISRIINIDTNERVTCSITQNGIIYVGTVFGQGSLSASKLYKSTNGINFIEIKSWNQDYGKNDTIESLTVDNSQSIYVGTYKGIFKQFLGSGNFFALIGTEGIVESLVVDSNNNIYAGTGYGLYKSTDGTEQDVYLCKKCFSFYEEKWWRKIFKHKFRYVCDCIKCINIKCLKEIINILNKEK